MTNKNSPSREMDIEEVKTLIKKKGKMVGVKKVSVKNGSIIVMQSETVKVRVKDIAGRISVRPIFPSIGNKVQMISSLLFIIVFFFINFPVFLISGIICGQAFSFLYHYPRSNQLRQNIVQLIQDHSRN